MRELLPSAARTIADVVAEVPTDRMGDPTPCGDWNVRELLNHLTYWTGAATTAARRQAPAGPPEGHDFVAEADWPRGFAARADAAVDAWADPAAWEGTTSLTGGEPAMPARGVIALIFCDWLLHGWDLSAAIGRPYTIDDALAEALHAWTADNAETGRRFGAFGPEVAVPADASPLERALGLAGRDPGWKPAPDHA